jgi:hypothetical protein
MPKLKSSQSSKIIPLKLTNADRKLLLEECLSLDEDFAKVIRETPLGEPVKLPLDDMESFLDCIIADANHVDDRKIANKLNRLSEKIDRLIEKFEGKSSTAKQSGVKMLNWLNTLLIEGIETGKTVTLPIKSSIKKGSVSLKLTSQQREALLHATRLPHRIKQRLEDVPKGTQSIEFTRKELDIIKEEVGQAVQYAPSPYKKQLLSMIRKITEVLDPHSFEDYVARPRKPTKSTIYQLKILLEGIKPQIWRRVQVKDCTLANLHEIIQIAFEWDNYHMYYFQIGHERYTNPRMIGDLGWKNECKIKLSQIFEAGHEKFGYIYDMGDDWHHSIVVEEALSAEPKTKYPRCIGGARACPPEDCGGVWGYEAFLEAIADADHERHEELLEWIGGEYDPELFDLGKVNKELNKVKQ